MVQMFLMVVLSDIRSVNINYCSTAPVIDGLIEEVWQGADSAYDFIQSEPYEKTPPSEKTVVYLLQDADNLYAAFRCWATSVKPVNQMTTNDDAVVLFLDPFGSRTTAYFFKVYVSGLYDDGWILDDGRSSDLSWDGIWNYAVKIYDDRYEVEMRIPFKSIRYKNGLSEWGIDFKRYIAQRQEDDYWTEVSQVEGFLVSKYGALKSIAPQATGYFFEVYPEAFARSHQVGDEPVELMMSGSMNLKWDITPQATLNATAYPDFAQIESDPFQLNLTRYEMLLSERRPFFLEGKEIFRMSDFGEGAGFYTPLHIFYSRRIGKSIGSDLVPIRAGLKMTAKTELYNLGTFGAYTGELRDGDTIIEPARGFAVLRAKRRVLQASDIGLLFSGAAVNSDTYNYAIGIDGVYRAGPSQLIVQSALSNRNDKLGWALSSGYKGFIIKNFLMLGNAEVLQDSFDVSDIGYVPWSGRKKVQLFTGPFITYRTGFLKSLWIGSGGMVTQEPDNDDWSKVGFFCLNPLFRNNWGADLEMTAGPYYEADTSYLYRGVFLSGWANSARYNLWLSGNVRYTYNYARYFLAYQASTWHGFYWSIMPRVSFNFDSYMWIEWDTTGVVLAMTPVATPRLDFTITPKMTFGIFNEFVFSTPRTDIGATKFLTNRFGFLFSYNFRPKSWFYIALNDYRVDMGTGSGLQMQNQVGAIKAKYLIYF